MGKKVLSTISLVMINVAAIGSIKNWPLIAEYGFASIFFYLLAALIFFFPVSLVSAELATGWPKAGGIYAWVKEAFGHRTGFLAIWLLWIENVFWYPTVLSFIAATLAYVFKPELAENGTYMAISILSLFWGSTLLNLCGIRVSSWISSIGATLGTFVPASLIIGFALYWVLSGHESAIPFSAGALLPNLTHFDQIAFFTGILLSLAGMEMSAIHAGDVRNPQKDYPKAILFSALVILGFSIAGVLSVAILVPKGEISLVAGSLQAFSRLLTTFGFEGLIPLMAILIAIGAIGSLTTWTLGPSRGLLEAAKDGDLPPLFRKVNKHNMPSSLLITQAIFVTILSLFFLFMKDLNSAYWILLIVVAQLYLVIYLLLFASAIRLRYTRPEVKRSYKIPGGIPGMLLVGGVGFLGTLFCLIIGFIPPAEIESATSSYYEVLLIGTVVFLCLCPKLILLFKKTWTKQ